MNKIKNLDLPHLIITIFFIILCILAFTNGLNLPSLLIETITRFGMNSILVLAMIPAIECGITLNFGISLGIAGGLLGGLLSIEFGLSGVLGFFAAIAMGIFFSSIIGYGYGILLNKVKGSEMTISTYAGFSAIAFMNMVWLIIPLKDPAMGWSLGDGLKNTISLENSFKHILNNFLRIKIAEGLYFPTGLILFAIFCSFLMWLFLRSKAGIAMSAGGTNPEFARSAGINVDKTRLLGTTISTAVAAVGIIVYAQSFGFLQLYNAPMMMAFATVASILLGGATVFRAKVSYLFIGTFLYQGILAFGLPVTSILAPEGNISEVIRIIISNGIILFALSQAKGGKSNV